MEQVNVNEENICFSSARNIFEKTPSSKVFQTRVGSNQQCSVINADNKSANSDCKGLTVVSTATLKRKPGRSINDDNINNSNNNLSADRKTEISVLKSSIHLALGDRSDVIVPGKLNRENSLGKGERPEESKKTVRFLDEQKVLKDTPVNPSDIHKGSLKMKNFSKDSSGLGDAKQLLMNDIVNFSGRTLRSTPKPQEKTLEVQIQESNLSEENHSNTSYLKLKVIPSSQKEILQTTVRPEDARQLLLNDIVNASGRTLKRVPKPQERSMDLKTQVALEPFTVFKTSEACQLSKASAVVPEQIANTFPDPSKFAQNNQLSDLNASSDQRRGVHINQLSSSKASCDLQKHIQNIKPYESKCIALKTNYTNDTSLTSGQNITHSSKSYDNKVDEDISNMTSRQNVIHSFKSCDSKMEGNISNLTSQSSIVPTLTKSQLSLSSKELATTPSSNDTKLKGNILDYNYDEDDAGDKNNDRVGDRLLLKDWDPIKLLEKMYRVDAAVENLSCDTSSSFMNKSGYMECLPISKTKDTFLKTWKRKFFRAQDGKLSFYEGTKEDKESGKLELSGGHVEDIGPRILGIEDGSGHYLVVRCQSEREAMDWKASIHSQTVGDVSTNWIQPLPGRMRDISASKRIVVIDIGSSSVRAGILDTSPTMPTLIFPNIVATNISSGSKVYGFEVLKPSIRSSSTISYPVKPSNKVEKYSLEWESLPGLFQHVFHQLRLQPHQCSIMFCTPTTFNNHIKSRFLEMFFKKFRVRAVSMMSQTLLALYSYKVDTGIVVDVGERIEILPVSDGFVVDGCVRRLPFGGQKVCDMFNSFLTGRKCRFSTDVEIQLVKYAVQNLCYVTMEYEQDFGKCLLNSQPYQRSLPLDSFDLPLEAAEPICGDLLCFKSTEGFFDMKAWGVDSPSLQQLIHKVISLCPIDSRRQMWRNICLSGGITLLPNFKERLEAELSKLTPPKVAVQVHASPYRHHASYLGACTLANMEAFHKSCITIEDWTSSNGECIEKVASY